MKWTFLVSRFDEDLPAGRQLNNDLRRYSEASGGHPALTMEVGAVVCAWELVDNIAYPGAEG